MIRPVRLFPVALLLSTPALAQEVPQPTPTPEVLPSPVIVVPPLDPTPAPRPTLVPAPAPLSPLASPTPTPRATETVRPVPRPRATPSATPAPSPIPTPLPSASPASADAPPVAAPTPVDAAPAPATTPARAADRPIWPWVLGAGLVLLVAFGLRRALRRREVEDDFEPVAEEVAPPVLPPEPAPAPRLALAFRPTRAGFNLLSATVEGEVEVENLGDAAAEGVRVRTGLLSAHVGQDADFAAFVAEPITRPSAPAFALAPGERRTLRLVAAAPREGLRAMTAGGRPMFVPIFAVNVLTADGAQLAQAFAVGIERVDSAKLAPFWLDVPPRSHTEVAARPHGPAVERR